MLKLEKEGVHIALVQEIRFKDTTTMHVGNWVYIGCGVNIDTPKASTGVGIFLSPQVKGALINFITLNDRIMGIFIKTAAGHMSIINHHSTSEDKKTEEEAHWENLAMLNRSMLRNNMKTIKYPKIIVGRHSRYIFL